MQFISDPLLYEWARANTDRDWEVDNQKTEGIFDALKPWLNTPLYLEMQKKEKSSTAPILSTKPESKKQKVKSTFLDDLAKHGASAEELKKLNNKLTQ